MTEAPVDYSASAASAAWSALVARVAATMGLDFSASRERDLRHAVASLAPALGLGDANACAAHLAASPWPRELQMRLAEQLTVGETYFFRDGPLLELFAHRLLPELIARKRAQGDLRLRLWSAGCSGGEEPYTLAILLRQVLPDIGRWDISLLATDINPAALAKAREGLYGPWSFRGVAPHVRDLWFEREAGGRWRVSPQVRAMVRFEEHNLAQPAPPPGLGPSEAFDWIFCRNVLMYFEPACASEAAERLAASLAPGGWLAVSPSEVCGMRFPHLDAVAFEHAVLLLRPIGNAPVQAPQAHRDAQAAGLGPQDEWQAETLPRLRPHTEPHADLPVGQQSQPQAEPLPEGPSQAQASALPADAALRQALQLADAGRFDEALACCESWLARERLEPRAHYLRGLLLLDRGGAGDAAQARESLRRCLYLDPGFRAAETALAGLARREAA